MTLTAEELRDLVLPLWRKWPQTKPEGLTWYDCPFDSGKTGSWQLDSLSIEDIAPDHAAALCIAQMVEVLISTGCTVFRDKLGMYCVESPAGDLIGHSPTLLHALLAACHKVREEQT